MLDAADHARVGRGHLGEADDVIGFHIGVRTHVRKDGETVLGVGDGGVMQGRTGRRSPSSS